MRVENPDPRLVALLQQGVDGGNGEFEEFLPAELAKSCDERDAAYVPMLTTEQHVVWVELW